jgi:hypothetical protein
VPRLCAGDQCHDKLPSRFEIQRMGNSSYGHPCSCVSSRAPGVAGVSNAPAARMNGMKKHGLVGGAGSAPQLMPVFCVGSSLALMASAAMGVQYPRR